MRWYNGYNDDRQITNKEIIGKQSTKKKNLQVFITGYADSA